VKGVTKIKVSNFGALEHDPATVQNAKKFEELTGIKVELLAWAEPPIVAKTISIFAAKARPSTFFCYDHPTTYMQMVAGRMAPPDRCHLDDPGVWKASMPLHQERLTAPDARSTVHRPGEDHDALLSALHCLEAPSSVGRVTGDGEESHLPTRPGASFSPQEERWISSILFRDMIYSRAEEWSMSEAKDCDQHPQKAKMPGRCSPTWCSPTRVHPTSVLEYSWMSASDMFCYGQGRHGHDSHCGCQPVQGSQEAPNIQNGLGSGSSAQWDASQARRVYGPIMTSTVT